MRELSEQVLLGRPVFIREVGLPPCVPVDSGSLTAILRTERMSPVSAQLRFLARLAWPWLAAGCTLHLPHDLLTMTTLVNQVATLVTNYTSATYVINAPYL